MNGIERMKLIYEEAFELWVSKSKTYGTLNNPHRNIELSKDISLEPWKNSLIKLIDKLSVVYAYMKDENYQHDESLRENLIDILNYCAISILFLDISEEEHEYANIDDLLSDMRKIIIDKKI
jgi:hypothetical protein